MLLLLVLLVLACGGDPESDPAAPDPGAPATVPVEPPPPELHIPDDAPLVVFLGDSLAAGLHLAGDEAFPAILQRSLAGRGLPFRLVNAGVSGSTTAAALGRVDWILRGDPDIVVVELGANDGFRGIPLETIEKNLEAIVRRILDGGARPLLLGIRLPPNYGREYAGGFDDLYARVAARTDASFVPFFMKGVAGEAERNLPDGIHPTPEGHRILATNLEEPLADLLDELRH